MPETARAFSMREDFRVFREFSIASVNFRMFPMYAGMKAFSNDFRVDSDAIS
jgi:hypothetical protein